MIVAGVHRRNILVFIYREEIRAKIDPRVDALQAVGKTPAAHKTQQFMTGKLQTVLMRPISQRRQKAAARQPSVGFKKVTAQPGRFLIFIQHQRQQRPARVIPALIHKFFQQSFVKHQAVEHTAEMFIPGIEPGIRLIDEQVFQRVAKEITHRLGIRLITGFDKPPGSPRVEQIHQPRGMAASSGKEDHPRAIQRCRPFLRQFKRHVAAVIRGRKHLAERSHIHRFARYGAGVCPDHLPVSPFGLAALIHPLLKGVPQPVTQAVVDAADAALRPPVLYPTLTPEQLPFAQVIVPGHRPAAGVPAYPVVIIIQPGGQSQPCRGFQGRAVGL